VFLLHLQHLLTKNAKVFESKKGRRERMMARGAASPMAKVMERVMAKAPPSQTPKKMPNPKSAIEFTQDMNIRPQTTASPFQVELTAPDISAYRTSNVDIDYVTRLDSGKPGPHVIVQALTHGNELSGAITLDYLFKQNFQPTCGVVSFIFANVAAYQMWDPANPDGNRYVEEDFNRVWSDEVLKGPRDSVELRRARELVAYIDTADYLLDLHSMSAPSAPLMVCGVRPKGGQKSINLSAQIGLPEWLMMDTGHVNGLRMIERAAFGDPSKHNTAILLEAGQHWEKACEQIARETTLKFLKVTGVTSAEWADSRCSLPPVEQKVVQVTEGYAAKSLDFEWLDVYNGLEVIEKSGTALAEDAGHVVCTPFDNAVLIMPTRSKRFTVGSTMVRYGRVEGLS
jgi:predicted deacylase